MLSSRGTHEAADDSADAAGNRSPVPPRRLGLRYRIAWRLNYLLLSTYGPAALGGTGQPDPRRRMREERAARTAALTAGAAAPVEPARPAVSR